MRIHSLWLVSLALASAHLLTAQATDDTQLKQVILFARHGVRSPSLTNAMLDKFSVQPYPDFGLQVDILTTQGAAIETALGSYYRLWLTKEGVLTGNDGQDAANVYFRAGMSSELIVDSAKYFASGMLPAATVNLNVQPGYDAVFDPVDAGVSKIDQQTAIAAVLGRLGGNPQSLATAYAPELALVRSVLLHYQGRDGMLPAAPPSTIDVTKIPFAVTAGQQGLPVGLGGLSTICGVIDPFIMEYANGMPLEQVGWGQLDPASISRTYHLYDKLLDLEYRTPYLAGVQSSNMASHVVRSLVQASTGKPVAGALASPSTKVILLLGTNTQITGLAGLLHLDWALPEFPLDEASPSGVLVFELRQSESTGQFVVRVSYTAQTFEQLRNVTPLTLSNPPATAPVFVPGCSTSNATFDCPLAGFVNVVDQAIDPQSIDLSN